MEAQAEIGSAENRYAILGKLASGGMADLFLARTQSSAGVERYVVLKRVLSHRADDITFVNMFLDEARLAAQLQHPNIAQVYDTGKLDNSYFFTMEYVHGETVRDLMRRAFEVDQMIPINCALTIIAGAASGLAHAHERLGNDGQPLNIVHRDVSPSTVMISYEGNVKIVDFGVAKATHRSVETQSGTVKGKMGYMAPEQCKGGEVDLRADLFGLGIVMWEVLVGDRLYKRATDFETMEAIVSEPAPAPSSRRADIPPAIDAVVLKLLQKAPGDRYQSAHELLDALEAAATATGHPFSMSALRRLVVDLFGQRPEPWLADMIAEQRDELLTVSGGIPIPRAGINGEMRLDRLLSQMGPVPRIASGTERIRDVEPPRRRRWPVVLVVVAALATTATVLALGRRSKASGTAPDDAAIATTPADADVAIVTATDAAIVAEVVDAAPEDPTDASVLTGPESLDTAMRAGRYADAMAACASDKKLVRTRAAVCTLAACHEHAVETARAWARGVPRNERATTLETCRAMGVALKATGRERPQTGSATKKPPEKCADPMECRK